MSHFLKTSLTLQFQCCQCSVAFKTFCQCNCSVRSNFIIYQNITSTMLFMMYQIWKNENIPSKFSDVSVLFFSRHLVNAVAPLNPITFSAETSFMMIKSKIIWTYHLISVISVRCYIQGFSPIQLLLHLQFYFLQHIFLSIIAFNHNYKINFNLLNSVMSACCCSQGMTPNPLLLHLQVHFLQYSSQTLSSIPFVK